MLVVVLQNSNMKKISNMFKKLSLMKFDLTFDPKEFDNYCKELFKTFVNLPFRSGFESFLAEAGLKDKLSISELFFYLKRMRQIHPLSITKEEFQLAMTEINLRSQENNLFGTIAGQKNNLSLKISAGIKAGIIDFRIDLFKMDDYRCVSREEIKQYLQEKKVTHFLLSVIDRNHFERCTPMTETPKSCSTNWILTSLTR